MKKVAISFLLLLPLVLHGQTTSDIPRLSGILSLPEEKESVFEFTTDCCGPRYAILAEGESWSGVKVRSIRPELRQVEVAVGGMQEPQTLALASATNNPANSTANLELVKASLHSTLDLYGRFSGKTLLYYPRLVSADFSQRARATNRFELARILEAVLAAQEIAAVPDGNKFTMIVPKSDTHYQATRAGPITKLAPALGRNTGWDNCLARRYDRPSVRIVRRADRRKVRPYRSRTEAHSTMDIFTDSHPTVEGRGKVRLRHSFRVARD
jgi:hypothetical protein